MTFLESHHRTEVTGSNATPNSGESSESKVLAELSLLGAETMDGTKRRKHLNSNFDKLLEAECGLA